MKKDVTIKEFLDSERMSEDELIRFRREVNVMNEQRHEAIVEFIGITSSSPLSIVLEYCAYGSLQNAMKKYPDKFDERMKMKCLLNASSAMEFLHSHDIIHRDLKPENLLIVTLEIDLI